MTNDEIIKKLEEQLDARERVQKNAERLRDFKAVAMITDRIIDILRNIKHLKDGESIRF